MAVKKTIELDVDTKAGLRAVEELGMSFEDAFTEADNLSGKIGELEDALYAMAASGDTSSDTYKELSEQVGIYKKVIIDTDMRVDAMSQTTNQKLGGALSGITSSFELGAGVMGAFGAESVEVEKALLKVQSAMAVSQGVQGIREAIPAFKAMKTAILSNVIVQRLLNAVMSMNPAAKIVAIVVALGSAIAMLWNPIKKLLSMMGLMKASTESATKANKKLNESFEKSEKLIKRLIESQKKQASQRLEQLESQGASEEALHKQRLEILRVEELSRKVELASIAKQILDKQKNLQKAIKENNKELKISITEELKEHLEKFKDLKSMDGDYLHNKTIENNNFRKQQSDAEDEANNNKLAKYKDYLSKKQALDNTALAVERELIAGEIGLLEEGFEKKQAIIINNFKNKREDLLSSKQYTQEQKATLQLLHDEQEAKALLLIDEAKAKALDEAEIKRNEDLDRRAQEALDRGKPDVGVMPSDELVSIGEKEEIEGQLIFDIKKKWSDATDAMRKISDSKQYEATQKGLADMTTALNSVSDLNNLLTDLSIQKAGTNEKQLEKARKKGFERSKKLQIGMAIIEGVKGTMSGFTSGMSMGFAAPVMAPLLAGLAAASASANIAKIKATTYGSSTGGLTPPTTASAPNIPAPTFNIVGNNSENQLAKSLGGQEQTVVKAYVVSGDITTAQSLDKNKIETATL